MPNHPDLPSRTRAFLIALLSLAILGTVTAVDASQPLWDADFDAPRTFRATTVVNYRAGPARNYPIKGKLAEGQEIPATGLIKGWFKIVIIHPGGNTEAGYVWQDYLVPAR